MQEMAFLETLSLVEVALIAFALLENNAYRTNNPGAELDPLVEAVRDS